MTLDHTDRARHHQIAQMTHTASFSVAAGGVYICGHSRTHQRNIAFSRPFSQMTERESVEREMLMADDWAAV